CPTSYCGRPPSQVVVPSGGGPADHTPVVRSSHPSCVVLPSQSRITVTAIGRPSPKPRPTVPTGPAGFSHAAAPFGPQQPTKPPPAGTLTLPCSRSPSAPRRPRLPLAEDHRAAAVTHDSSPPQSISVHAK